MTKKNITSALIIAIAALSSASPAWAGKAVNDFVETQRVLAFLAAQNAAKAPAAAPAETAPPPPPPPPPPGPGR